MQYAGDAILLLPNSANFNTSNLNVSLKLTKKINFFFAKLTTTLTKASDSQEAIGPVECRTRAQRLDGRLVFCVKQI